MENVQEAALPPSWAWARLGDISAVSGGLTKNRGRNTSGMTSAPFLRVANVQSGYVDLEDLHLIEASTQEIERLSLRRGDMLVVEGNGSLSQVGRCAIWDNDLSGCIHQNHIIRVRLNKPEQANWVFRWLSSQHGRTFIERSASSTSGLHTLSISKIENLPVPIAPEREQDQILEIIESSLDDIGDVEAAMKRARGQMADYRASLLHAACTGALTADWRAANPRPAEDGPALLRRILAERRAAWERTELARLTAAGKVPRGEGWKASYTEPCLPPEAHRLTTPEGWTIATLDQLLGEPPRNGISVKGRSEPPGTPALRLDALGDDRIFYDRCRYIDITARQATALTILDGDLLVSRANGSKRLVGRASLVAAAPAKMVFPDTIIRCRLMLPKLGPWIAMNWANAATRGQLERSAKTSAGIWKLGQDDLTSVLIPLPPLSEIDVALAQIAAGSIPPQEVFQGEMNDLRQSILHAAFSGRLVPQDPAEEPAATLLAHLRAEAATSPPRRRSARTKAPRP